MNRFLSFLMILLLPAGSLWLYGCSEDTPPGLLREPVYTGILTEVFLARSRVDYLEVREREDSLIHVLLDRHDVSREDFEMSHEYYQRQPERQAMRIEAIRSSLTAERDTLLKVRQEARLNRQ